MGGDSVSWRRLWPHQPTLDGLRAIAVVAVVLFHFFPDVFPGGFVGVDIFFVLSGYLITGMLFLEHDETRRIDLAAFWWRRVWRLVPAVIVLVVVCALAVWATGTGSQRGLFDSLGALTWTTNLVELHFGGSRAWLVNPRTVLDHLWSLAIEEQFYLVWPLVLLAILRWVPGRRGRLLVVGILGVASATVMASLPQLAAYFRADSRAFELLAGALLALGGWRFRSVARVAVPVVGAVLLIAFVASADNQSALMYPWGFLAVAGVTVAVLMAVLDPSPVMLTVLAAPPMQYVGRLSYGIYLWHIPVLRLFSTQRLGFEGIGVHVVRFTVLAVVVEASYRLVEQPCRSGVGLAGARLGARHLGVGYAVAALALLPLVGAARRDAIDQWNVLTDPPEVASGESKVLVLGDLMGAAVAAELADEAGLAVWDGTDPGCWFSEDVRAWTTESAIPVVPECVHWRQRWREAIERFDPDRVVVGLGLWDQMELRSDGRVLEGAELDRRYRELWTEVADLLAGSGAEATVVRIDDWRGLVEEAQRSDADLAIVTPQFNTALDSGLPGDEVFMIEEVEDWDDVRAVVAVELDERLGDGAPG